MLRNFEVIKKLNELGFDNIKSSQQLNKLLEQSGLIEKTTNGWLRTGKGMNYSGYKFPEYRPNEWTDNIIPFLSDILKK